MPNELLTYIGLLTSLTLMCLFFVDLGAGVAGVKPTLVNMNHNTQRGRTSHSRMRQNADIEAEAVLKHLSHLIRNKPKGGLEDMVRGITASPTPSPPLPKDPFPEP